MSTSAVGTVLDAIRAGLILRDGLSGVNVFSGPVKMEEAGTECMAFGDCRLNEEAMAMGGFREEVWDIDGEVRTVVGATWQGTTETTIKAIRDRALAIFAELEAYINDTYVSTLPVVELTTGQITQDIGPEGRVCWLSFTMQLRSAIEP